MHRCSPKLPRRNIAIAADRQPVPSNHQQKSVRMNNTFGSNADQGTGSSAEENMMLNKMLELFSAMEEKLAVRDAAMEKRLVSLEGKFDELKKELEDKEDEAWRGKHGPP